MSTRIAIIVSCIFICAALHSQTVQKTYKIDDLLSRINAEKKPVIVNFWATWCKPCIEELPAFDSLAALHPEYKVLLVCIDFKEELKDKVNPFLQRKHIKSECVLLDEINGNDFIDKISPDWSGAIPGTLFKGNNQRFFVEKKMKLKNLEEQCEKIKDL